jgi:CIC family chloride channel protein
VVFVAETTGGHSFIIPSLIGAAIAYAVSGEASVSGDQHFQELAKLEGLSNVPVREVMQKRVVSVPANATLREFVQSIAVHHQHTVFPVQDGSRVVGLVSLAVLGSTPSEKWDSITVRAIADLTPTFVYEDCDLMEALRLLASENPDPMLLVTATDGELTGIVTKTDILRAVESSRGSRTSSNWDR